MPEGVTQPPKPEGWWRSQKAAVSTRRYLWRITGTTVALTMVGVGVIVFALIYIESTTQGPEPAVLTLWGYVARFTILIAPLILGLIWAPGPKPQDYSDTAAIAVDDLAEMHRSNTALVDEIGGNLTSDSDHPDKILLVRVVQELSGQRRQIERQISGWARVSPGVGDEIVKGRKTHAAILKKLEGELDVDEEAAR